MAVVFDNVVKTYRTGLFGQGGVKAVRGVSLSVPTGSIFGLLGPNRAGKTTLVKMLLSLTTPTSGAISRLQAPIADRRTLGRIGYMHENHAFPRYLSAAEVLDFYGGLSGVPGDELAGRVDRLLTRVGLADRMNEPISRFSKGMIQRLGLAQALVNDPDLLVLDEPTEGLDLFGRQLMRQIVQEFKAAGKTIMLVSHALPEVQELCDQVAIIVSGNLVFAGRMTDLLRDTRSNEPRALESAIRPLYEKGLAP